MSKKTNYIISALITLALGITLIIYRAQVISWVLLIIGALLVIFGIIDLTKKRIIGALIFLFLGASVIVSVLGLNQFGVEVAKIFNVIVTIILYALGVFLIIIGIFAVIKLINAHNTYSSPFSMMFSYLIPVIYIFIGICLFFNQTGIVNLFFLIAGIMLVIQGTLYLVVALPMKE